jgi:hypothetical protein
VSFPVLPVCCRLLQWVFGFVCLNQDFQDFQIFRMCVEFWCFVWFIFCLFVIYGFAGFLPVVAVGV